jgi:hypothetical protein
MRNRLKQVVILFAILALNACGKSEDKKASAEKPGAAESAKESPGSRTGQADPGLDRMVSAVAEQAAKQGVKIDSAEQKEALRQVIKLYLLRSDLQKAFGGPGDVDFTTMIKWAAVSGTTTDSDKDKLAAYASPLHAIANQVGDAVIRVRLE